MSSRNLVSPSTGNALNKDDGGKETVGSAGNAMWRIPEWFPNMPAAALEQLKAYHTELLKFNLRLNLVSKNSEREADEQHFADCLLAVEIILKQPLPERVFDIGSGNGLPGLVLAILDPKREVHLVESDMRKAEFLKHVSTTVKLKNVKIIVARFESLKEAGMMCGVSRGFASISKTVLTCNKIFESGGQFFHLKSNSWSSEVAELPSQLISVWSPKLVGDYVLPVSQARRAVVSTQKK